MMNLTYQESDPMSLELNVHTRNKQDQVNISNDGNIYVSHLIMS